MTDYFSFSNVREMSKFRNLEVFIETCLCKTNKTIHGLQTEKGNSISIHQWQSTWGISIHAIPIPFTKKGSIPMIHIPYVKNPIPFLIFVIHKYPVPRLQKRLYPVSVYKKRYIPIQSVNIWIYDHILVRNDPGWQVCISSRARFPWPKFSPKTAADFTKFWKIKRFIAVNFKYFVNDQPPKIHQPAPPILVIIWKETYR